MSTINLIDHPPRPDSGTGEIVDSADGVEVVLSWLNGKLIDVAAVADDQVMGDLNITSSRSAVPFCYKCILDSDGNPLSCWAVPC